MGETTSKLSQKSIDNLVENIVQEIVTLTLELNHQESYIFSHEDHQGIYIKDCDNVQREEYTEIGFEELKKGLEIYSKQTTRDQDGVKYKMLLHPLEEDGIEVRLRKVD